MNRQLFMQRVSVSLLENECKQARNVSFKDGFLDQNDSKWT